MLTASALGTHDSSNAAAILADRPPPKKAKKDVASKIYENELEMPKNLDLGLKGVSRAQLRAWVKESILEASVTKRRKYSHSALSSALSGIDTTGNAKNALKQLQKERLIVSRMGFPDRAMEIDAEIDRMLTKVKQVREQEEKDLLDYRLKMLAAAQGRKRQVLEAEIADEVTKLEETLKHEHAKVRGRDVHSVPSFLLILTAFTHSTLDRVLAGPETAKRGVHAVDGERVAPRHRQGQEMQLHRALPVQPQQGTC